MLYIIFTFNMHCSVYCVKRIKGIGFKTDYEYTLIQNKRKILQLIIISYIICNNSCISQCLCFIFY